MIWKSWWKLITELKPACSRTRTFLWMTLSIAGITIRSDLLGVTSIIRALGLRPECYLRLLDFFHSPALHLGKLTMEWRRLVFKSLPGIIRIDGRPVLVGDGIKVPKSGKKMPAVKKLHQESESNTKPEFIFGHSCQAVAVLAKTLSSVFAVPLACRIHEGVIFSNRDKRTLLDKMLLLLETLNIEEPFIFVADAYYASRRIINGLLEKQCHLVTRVRSNAVAYEKHIPPKPQEKRRRGRPRKYGNKIKVSSLLDKNGEFCEAQSPLHGEKNVTIRYRTNDLLWRPVGILVRFVAVIHPIRGEMILMTTDLEIPPLEIFRIYALRFKIELSFKQAIRVIGVYAYHFWMRAMTPLKRKSGNQHLHRKTDKYRNDVRRKIEAYHRHIQLGLIAQGLLQILAINEPSTVWQSFGSWLRTIRPGIPPSEMVTAIALRNKLPEFLADCDKNTILKKFWQDRIDRDRMEGMRLAG